MQYDGKEVSGKLRVNGEKYKLGTSDDIEIKTESDMEGASNSITIKSSSNSENTEIEETKEVELDIEHDAGPEPDPESIIKVTIDDEDIQTVTDIGPDEVVDIHYSHSESTSESNNNDSSSNLETNSTTETNTPEEAFQELNPAGNTAKSATLIDNIKDILNNIASFFQNLFS